MSVLGGLGSAGVVVVEGDGEGDGEGDPAGLVPIAKVPVTASGDEVGDDPPAAHDATSMQAATMSAARAITR
jgi:hypothetical protein